MTGGPQTGGKAWGGAGDRGRRVQTVHFTSYLAMTLHAEEREKPLFFCDGHGLLMAPKHKAQLGPSSTT